MRKQKPQPLLNAYHRKQNARSAAYVASQPPMSTEQWLKQHADLRRQKHEYLQQNVVQTDPVTGMIQWSMWSHAPNGGLGHGVHYHDSLRTDDNLVAFIRGFAWKRDPDIIVHGYYIRPDAITPAKVMADLKQQIAELLTANTQHYYPETWITERFLACGNC